MKVHIYVRVSSRTQKNSGLGIERQKEECLKWINYRLKSLGGIFHDEAISGVSGLKKMLGLSAAIDSLKPGDILLVERRDRVGRSIKHMIEIEELIKEKGARLISVAGEGTEDDSPTGRFTRAIFDAHAELTREISRQRCRSSVHLKKMRGERIGYIPYGKQLGKDGVLLEDCKQERLRIKQVIKLFHEGHSWGDMAKEMVKKNLLNRKEKPWTPSSIARLTHKHMKKFKQLKTKS
jgi:site-specific DNA recombinase